MCVAVKQVAGTVMGFCVSDDLSVIDNCFHMMTFNSQCRIISLWITANSQLPLLASCLSCDKNLVQHKLALFRVFICDILAGKNQHPASYS